MAEVMPASFTRRWTVAAPRRGKRGVLPGRLRLGLLLAAVAFILAGASAGLLAWWKPLQRPAVIVLASAPQGNVNIQRALAMEADGAAIARQISPHARIIADDVAPTRSELLHYVNMIRLAKGHEHVVLQISAVAGVSPRGDVMLFTSDSGPLQIESATPLRELLGAIEACRAHSLLVLLDLVSASGATLQIVPAADLAASVDDEIRRAELGHAAIVTSHSSGERSQLLPGTNRTLFGWVIDRGLAGAADGAVDELRDGRVTTEELLAYTTTTLPPLALRMTAQRQQPQVYGTTQVFDIAVVAEKPAPNIAAVDYPAWLVDAWAKWNAAKALLDDQTVSAWEQSLRRAEIGAMTGASADEVKKLRAALTVFKSPAAISVAADTALQTALEQYLVARRDAIEQVPPAQAKPTEQKLLVALIKAHGAAPASSVARVACTVAGSSAHASLDDWQALLRLLDAWPNLPDSEERSHLQALAALCASTPGDEKLAEAARFSLLAANECGQSAHDLQTWPWMRTLLDQALDARAHGDTLLFARGYASSADALAALNQAYDDARRLREASRSIGAVLRSQAANRRFIADHAYLAEQELPLAEAWIQAVNILHQLDRLLDKPAAPFAAGAELRALVRDLNSASATVESSLLLLRERLSATEIAQAIVACQQPDADAHDLYRADTLLQSNSLTPSDRRNLWLAYAALSRKLLENPVANPRLSLEGTSAATSLQSRRLAMHDAWQKYTSQSPGAHQSAVAADLDLWWRDWQRFRTEEIARVMQASGPPVWSSAALEVLGPFSCDALTPAQPQATLELMWQERRDNTSPPAVSVISPGDALAIAVQNPLPKPGDPVRFQLRLLESAKSSLAGDGFLAIFKTQGRTYHAPIALPGLQHSQAVNILLSSSSTQLQLLERVPLVSGNAAVYVWVENTTSDAQQVTVNLGSTAASAPLALAAHEIRCVALAPPTTASPQSELVISVQDVATQRKLAERRFAFFAPSAGQLIACKSARIENAAARGSVLTVEAELARTSAAGMTVSLQPTRSKDGRTLMISGGRTRATLTPLLRDQTLTATLETLPANELVRCEVYVEGIREPLILTGRFPASGETTTLREDHTPQIAIAGDAVSQPVSTYSLAITPFAAATDAKISLLLRSAVDGSTVLARQVDALAPPLASLTATTPPGGLIVSPIVTPATQTFDTNGLVGRFVWHAELMSGTTIVATAECPVVFDATPPTGCRFVRPAAHATKASIVELQVAGWDDLTEISSVQLFIGKPVDGKSPPASRMFAATKSTQDASIWNASVTLPNELGPCEITALVTNAAGLSTAVTTSVTVLDSLPIAQGEIRGAVLEGALAQAGLDVTLEKTAGAALKTTKTDANGQFTFSDVAPGSYTVRSTKTSSQRTGSAPVKVEGGQTITATIKLAL